MFYRLTQAQADQLASLRANRQSRRNFWRSVRSSLNLASSKSTGTIRVAYADTNNPLWLILRSKRTNLPIGGTVDGESTSTLLALGLAKAPAPAPEPAPKAAPKAKPAPAAKKAAPAKKPAAPAAKKAVGKPAVKKAAAAKAAPTAAAKATKASTPSTKASKPSATRPASKVARKATSR